MVDKSAVGETGEAFDLTVERGKVREFARATKSENPEYLDAADPVSEPTFLVSSVFWAPPGANRWGKLNCLLSDGRRLFCYHDLAGYKGLHQREVRIRDNEVRRFQDSAVTIDLAGESVNRGFVVATRPLSDWGWRSCRPGELMVLEEGVMQFSDDRGTVSARAE